MDIVKVPPIEQHPSQIFVTEPENDKKKMNMPLLFTDADILYKNYKIKKKLSHVMWGNSYTKYRYSFCQILV